MAKDIRFFIDQTGANEGIYREQHKLLELERDLAERAYSEAKATFLQDFGFEPNLYLEFRWSKVSSEYFSGGLRPIYRISAGDSRTGAVLKQHPGWLGRFSENARF